MKYNKKHIPVEPETHQRFKIASVKAGMNYDELIKYALNLIAAYPPNSGKRKYHLDHHDPEIANSEAV